MTVYIESGGEKWIGFARQKMRELKESLTTHGGTVGSKWFDVGESTIYINTVRAMGNWLDTIKITSVKGGYFGIYNPTQLSVDGVPFAGGNFGLMLTRDWPGSARGYSYTALSLQLIPTAARSFKQGMILDPYLLAQAPAEYPDIALYFTPGLNTLGVSSHKVYNQLNRFRYFPDRDGGTLLMANGSATDGPAVSWTLNCEQNADLLIFAERGPVVYDDGVTARLISSINTAVNSSGAAALAMYEAAGSFLTNITAYKFSPPTIPDHVLAAPEAVMTIPMPANTTNVSAAMAFVGDVLYMAYIYITQVFDAFGVGATSSELILTSTQGVIFTQLLYSGADLNQVFYVRGLKVASNGGDYIITYGGPIDGPSAVDLNIRTHLGTVSLPYNDNNAFVNQDHQMDISVDGIPAACFMSSGDWVVQVGSYPAFTKDIFPIPQLPSPDFYRRLGAWCEMACIWTPDGKYLLALNGEHLMVISSDGQRLFNSTQLSNGDFISDKIPPSMGHLCFTPVGFFITNGSEAAGYRCVSLNAGFVDGVAEFTVMIERETPSAATVAVTIKNSVSYTSGVPPLYAGGVDDTRRPYV